MYLERYIFSPCFEPSFQYRLTLSNLALAESMFCAAKIISAKALATSGFKVFSARK